MMVEKGDNLRKVRTNIWYYGLMCAAYGICCFLAARKYLVEKNKLTQE